MEPVSQEALKDKKSQIHTQTCSTRKREDYRKDSETKHRRSGRTQEPEFEKLSCSSRTTCFPHQCFSLRPLLLPQHTPGPGMAVQNLPLDHVCISQLPALRRRGLGWLALLSRQTVDRCPLLIYWEEAGPWGWPGWGRAWARE